MEKLYAALYAATAEAGVVSMDGRISLHDAIIIVLAFLGAGHVWLSTNTKP